MKPTSISSVDEFSLKRVRDAFGLTLKQSMGLFADVEPLSYSDHLRTALAENVPLALSINTAKARSELIVVNLLLELRRRYESEISLFSGVGFSVSEGEGAMVECDFLVSGSSEQLFLTPPLLFVVETINDNLAASLGKCIAQMVAARLYNEREAVTSERIYGVLTSGTAWRFASLEGSVVNLDMRDYAIEDPGRILGILASMASQGN